MQSKTNLIPSSDLVIDKKNKLGKGAYGIVYQGLLNNKTVAVKIARSTKITTLEKSISELNQEQIILSKIKESWKSSKNTSVTGLMEYYGYSKTLEYPILLVIEYANRGSIGDWVYDFGEKKYHTDFSWELAYPVVLDIAMGLYWLHQFKYIHNDIKVDNMLLNEENGKLTGKIGDFGHAQRVVKVNYFFGSTLFYNAPEVLIKSIVTQKSDIFSFSCALFEMAIQDLIYSSFYDDAEMRELKFLKDHVINKDLRDDIPDNTPKKIAHLITWGWKAKQEDRPTAEQVVNNLKTPMDEMSAELKIYTPIKYF